MNFVKSIFLLNLIALYCALTNAACSDLVTFTHPSVSAVSGTIRVHTNFKNYMTQLGNLAAGCSAKIYVTSSYRSAGTSVTNTVVPPASYSNHNAGYAVDLNLGPSTSSSIGCNSACLGQQPFFNLLKEFERVV